MLCTIVHQDDGTVSKVLVVQNTVGNLFCCIVFPVQTVTVRYKSKDKYFKIIFFEILRCFSKKKILLDRNSIFVSFKITNWDLTTSRLIGTIIQISIDHIHFIIIKRKNLC